MGIANIQKNIVPILKRYGVVQAAVFGSFARGQQKKNSDLDLLVKFGTGPGLAQYLGAKRALEKKLGRRVDLVTESSLNKFVRPHVLEDLKLLYVDKKA